MFAILPQQTFNFADYLNNQFQPQSTAQAFSQAGFPCRSQAYAQAITSQNFSIPTVKYAIEEDSNDLIITLYKLLPNNLPVSSSFLSNENLIKFKKNLSKNLFIDYEIELINDNNSLKIISQSDNFEKTFNLINYNISDLKLIDLNIHQDSIAYLKVRLINNKCKTDSINHEELELKRIQDLKLKRINEVRQARLQKEKQTRLAAYQEKKRLEQERLAAIEEAKRLAAIEEEKQALEQARLDLLEKELKERIEQKRVEQERYKAQQLIKQYEEEQAAIQKLKEEEERKILLQLEKEAQLKQQRLRQQRQEQEQEQYRIQQKAQKKIKKTYNDMIDRQTQQHIATLNAMKEAQRLEQERVQAQRLQEKEDEERKRLREYVLQKRREFKEEQEKYQANSPKSPKYENRFQSPVLEDVDDEEVDRYRKSLDRSPRGSSIIEDL